MTFDVLPFKEVLVPQKNVPRVPGLKIQNDFKCNICPVSYMTINKEKYIITTRNTDWE
jgi:hypothetical protein